MIYEHMQGRSQKHDSIMKKLIVLADLLVENCIEHLKLIEKQSPNFDLHDGLTNGIIHTLKTEFIYRQRFARIEQAAFCLKQWIDVYYNCRRLHSALGYKSPLFYELSRIPAFKMSA